MNRRILALGSSICMTAAVLVASQAATAPLAEASSASPFSTSYYVTTGNTTAGRSWAYNQGYALGRIAYNTAGTQWFTVILDFASMNLAGSTWMLTEWQYADITLADAGELVYQFGFGFYIGAATDHTSVVNVGLGTNSSGTTTTAGGKALAVQALSTGKRFSSLTYRQVNVVGAMDFENEAGWASYASDYNWFSGYMGVSARPILLNYGSANGCPSDPSVAPAKTKTCTANFTVENIWTLSWSQGAYPVPEIYATSGINARQWKWLSNYSNTVHGSYFIFKGVLTQMVACQQMRNCAAGTKYATDNIPAVGWQQLLNQLNAAPKAGGGIEEQPTDIQWGK